MSGALTVRDAMLYEYLRDLWETERIFVEPSAAAAFAGPARLQQSVPPRQYLLVNGLTDKLAAATQLVWATGGRLVPAGIREAYLMDAPLSGQQKIYVRHCGAWQRG